MRACDHQGEGQHFCEFSVSGNAAIWGYSAAQLAGIKVGWMSFSAPSAYKSISIRGRSRLLMNFFTAPKFESEVPLQATSIGAGVALSVYNADTVEMAYDKKYYPQMKAVCTELSCRLLGRIGSEGLYGASHRIFTGSL